jgi:predicted phosphate transport protein (TIGR00153 family)
MNVNAIFQFLVPKDSKFFPLFEQVATNLLDGSKAFKVLTSEKDLSKLDDHIKKVKELEQKGDNLTHEIFLALNSTFITPFDRQDIQTLTSSMDDVLDYINGTCQRIRAYRPVQLPTELDQMADILVQSSELILKSIKQLNNHRNFEQIKAHCVLINTYENQADELYHTGLSKLFKEEKDPIELIKNKEILQTIEKATDCAEDVSDVLKTIIIKQA